MQRRQALLSIASALTVCGCQGLDDPRPPSSRLAYVWLVNDRDEPYEVDVVVTDEAATVFEETFEVGTTPETANVTVEDPVDGTGRYVVRATMDGATRTVDTTDVVDGDETCVGVRFTLLDNGSVDYWTKSMEQC